MDNQLLHDRFIAELREKLPHKSKMAATLAEILVIEKEAVYRRLRREVPFTFQEVARISQILGISVDNIIGVTTEKSRPFQLKLAEYYEPEEVDYLMMEQYGTVLDFMSKEPYSECNYSGNHIPNILWQPYRKLHNFHVFYWKYQYDSDDHKVPYGAVNMSERMRKFAIEAADSIHHFKSVSLILDRSFISTLVDEIQFFHNINLITPEEKQELREEILQFIDDLEAMAVRGTWDDTDNPVYIYISSIHFDTNYTCMESGGYYLSLINTFTLNSVASLDHGTYDKMKSWLQSAKRVSTLISRSGEMQRILFFTKQREIVSAL